MKFTYNILIRNFLLLIFCIGIYISTSCSGNQSNSFSGPTPGIETIVAKLLSTQMAATQLAGTQAANVMITNYKITEMFSTSFPIQNYILTGTPSPKDLEMNPQLTYFVQNITPAVTFAIPGFQTTDYLSQEGDNCITVAQKFKTDLQEIQRINQVDCSIPFQPGQIIQVPFHPTSTPRSAKGYIEYVTKNGDSCTSISMISNISIQEFEQANNIDCKKTWFPFSPGQKIRIPVY